MKAPNLTFYFFRAARAKAVIASSVARRKKRIDIFKRAEKYVKVGGILDMFYK